MRTLKIVINIVAILSLLSGGMWFLQGVGVLPGSFMTGQSRWAINGGIVMAVSAAVLYFVNRRTAR